LKDRRQKTEDRRQKTEDDQCGGGFENLHREPASRRRRRKGKSQIWDPRKTRLARASSIYKRQTRPLVKEGTPENKTETVKE
jgi:hypothetical protein